MQPSVNITPNDYIRPDKAGNNQERKQAKIARMHRFIDEVISEYRQDKISRGLWKIAEQQGISIGTLNAWYSDADFQPIAAELKTVRKMIVEDKIARAIVNGEGVTMISNLIGYLNRLDPITQRLDASVSHISILSGVRRDLSEVELAEVVVDNAGKLTE